MAGDEGGLEHHMPLQSSTTANGALAAHCSTVMPNWRKACERCSPFTRDVTEFRHSLSGRVFRSNIPNRSAISMVLATVYRPS